LYTSRVNFRSRQAQLQRSLEASRLDALLVTHLPNIRYLCGFTGSAAALLIAEDNCVFFSDGRYGEQSREEVQSARIVIARKAPLLAAAEWLRLNRSTSGSSTLGIEAEHLTVAERKRLFKAVSSKTRIREAPPLVEQLRMVKDPDEIEKVRAAVNLGASLFARLLRAIRPGVKETQAAAEFEYAARSGGAEAMSFPTIIAAGKRSALPHARASEAKIPRLGFVVCDFGVILAGYCSDMTRTLHVGRPRRQARRLYEAVLQAQLAAIAAVRPGVRVREVDAAARKLLQKHGFGRYFTHSTGHGVGLEIHEAPKVAAGGSEILKPGMIITIEPGAYLAGRYGVRIEDMVVVTKHGCEVLTPTPKELVEI